MKSFEKRFEIPEFELIELEEVDIMLASTEVPLIDDEEQGIDLPIIPIG